MESPFAAVRLRTAAAKRYNEVENARAGNWKRLLFSDVGHGGEPVMERRSVIAMVLALAAVVAAVSPAAAQLSKSPRNAASVKGKLEKSAELQRQALQALADLGRAERLVGNAHEELRSAKDDMVIIASNAKFPDPLSASNQRRTDQALSLLLGALDGLKLRDKWSEPDKRVAGVRNNLEQALRLTNTVLATSP